MYYLGGSGAGLKPQLVLDSHGNKGIAFTNNLTTDSGAPAGSATLQRSNGHGTERLIVPINDLAKLGANTAQKSDNVRRQNLGKMPTGMKH